MALIMAAGSSSRMGEDKQFMKLGGKSVLARTISVFEDCGAVSDIIVVTKKESVDRVRRLVEQYRFTKVIQVIPGGKERVESVFMGLQKISKEYGLVAIHDGARPLVTKEIVEKTIRTAQKFNAAAPAEPVTSTVKRVKNDAIVETIDRQELALVQTPQVFEASLIKGAIQKAIQDKAPITDDCMAAERIGITVHLTEGSRENIKLTTQEDMIFAEAILRSRRKK